MATGTAGYNSSVAHDPVGGGKTRGAGVADVTLKRGSDV